MANMTKQVRVGRRATMDKNVGVEEVALFHSDGSAASLVAALATTATAIGTAAKTVSSAEPPANTLVPIKFTNGNSASSVTVAFNGGSARAVQFSGAAVTNVELALAANAVALFYFDGTILHQVGVYT